ncbi:TENX-like protein [Mya arenaria]|uniref:TENX-like protein n=1 Tax=Mya arenaria TaxID=6604 RepID=A0ABY7FIS0_MYAAR|nr:TENX-like protein [Mya arenaria]
MGTNSHAWSGWRESLSMTEMKIRRIPSTGKVCAGRVHRQDAVYGQSYTFFFSRDISRSRRIGAGSRRVSASDFYKTWDEYKHGFGDLDGNFWLGNDKIVSLCNDEQFELRIDMELGDDTRYAQYSSFSVEDESQNYRLHVMDSVVLQGIVWRFTITMSFQQTTETTMLVRETVQRYLREHGGSLIVNNDKALEDRIGS